MKNTNLPSFKDFSKSFEDKKIDEAMGSVSSKLKKSTEDFHNAQLELQKLKNLDSLVINALRYESHPSHLNVQEALEIVDTIKPKNTFFTHISHNMGFHEEVCDKLPDSVSLAYDGLVLEIN